MTAALQKQGKISRIVNAISRGIRAIIRSLRSSTAAPGGAPGQTPAAPIEFVPDTTAEADDTDELDHDNGYESAYLARQVQDYNTAFESMDFERRTEIRTELEGMSDKSRAVIKWVSHLSDNDRAILMNCSRDQIANHISGVDPIEGVAAVGQGVPYAVRPHTPRPSAEIIELANARPMKPAPSMEPNTDEAWRAAERSFYQQMPLENTPDEFIPGTPAYAREHGDYYSEDFSAHDREALALLDRAEAPTRADDYDMPTPKMAGRSYH